MSEQTKAEQSASVTRYRMADSSCGWRYFAVADGEWVTHEDYAALESQLAAAVRRAEEAEKALARIASMPTTRTRDTISPGMAYSLLEEAGRTAAAAINRAKGGTDG